MQLTPNYNLKKPEETDPIDILDLNDNADIIDAEFKKRPVASGGDVSEMTVKTLETITTEFPVPVAGESTKTFLGKVKKFFEDTKNWMTGVCLIGQIVNNCVTNNAKLPLSAAQGKVLMDLYTVLNTKIDSLDTEPIWLFKPGEGLLVDGKPGTYTYTQITADYLKIWPQNTTQTQSYFFGMDFSEYIGKGYKVKLVYTLSSVNIGFFQMVAIYYNPLFGFSGWVRELYTTNVANKDLTVILSLDDCVTPTYPFVGIQYGPNNNNISLAIKEFCIFK